MLAGKRTYGDAGLERHLHKQRHVTFARGQPRESFKSPSAEHNPAAQVSRFTINYKQPFHGYYVNYDGNEIILVKLGILLGKSQSNCTTTHLRNAIYTSWRQSRLCSTCN
jgi:hypothetical protein